MFLSPNSPEFFLHPPKSQFRYAAVLPKLRETRNTKSVLNSRPTEKFGDAIAAENRLSMIWKKKKLKIFKYKYTYNGITRGKKQWVSTTWAPWYIQTSIAWALSPHKSFTYFSQIINCQ